MVGSDPSTGFGLPARPRRERAQSVAQALTLREEGAAVERDQRPAGCLAQDGPVLGSVSPPRRRRARGTGVAASARDGRGPHPRPPATASDHVSSSLTACAAASSSHPGCWRGAVSVARRIASRAVGPLLPITLPTAAREPLPLPAATRPARAPLLAHDLDRPPRRLDRQRLRAVRDSPLVTRPRAPRPVGRLAHRARGAGEAWSG